MFFITNGIDGYKRAFCYKGVADRKSYFFFALFPFVFFTLFELILLYFQTVTLNLYGEIQVRNIVIPALFATIIYSFLASSAFTVRRLHDIGLSGWWSTLYFCVVLILVLFITLVMFFIFTPTDRYLHFIIFSTILFYMVSLVFYFLLALPKSKIEKNKYRPDDSISTPATDEAVS
ncbi:DUF805 domain-containing protein [Buttiauxella sp. 3AFRM03]|uniref:DUF805 domain-containing protein n=1 Tax=Buttiauxella sp. 3AFRM03 TaxID=2479367 RepID=UPI000EF7C73C|nr:DUF805 domain-containing protein [Buttiauxella sp. 3AFRM03]AYN30197.1 DUF805 domain-containing protein [Buttiauxella sp. 3AFRM03]